MRIFLASAALAAGISMPTTAGSQNLFADFRTGDFSNASGKNSVESIVAGTGFTVSAFAKEGEDIVSRSLYQDAVDGLGILGGENDEIDATEFLNIEFENTIGLSALIFSDLFVEDNAGPWGENVEVVLNGTQTVQANVMTGLTEGFTLPNGGTLNAANGEAALTFDDILPVNSIQVRAPMTGSNNDFSLIGFVDPPLDIPAPAPMGLALAAFGVLMWQRRLPRAAAA